MANEQQPNNLNNDPVKKKKTQHMYKVALMPKHNILLNMCMTVLPSYYKKAWKYSVHGELLFHHDWGFGIFLPEAGKKIGACAGNVTVEWKHTTIRHLVAMRTPNNDTAHQS